MLNLLRFKAATDGIDAGVTGAEAYAATASKPSRCCEVSAAGCSVPSDQSGA